MIRLALILATLSTLPFWSTAQAQQDWSRLNQWKVACTPEGVCQMTYENVRDNAVRSKILIYRVGDAIILEYTIPLGIDIRRGVNLVVDRTQTIPTDILTCRAEGCVGFQVVSNRLLQTLAAGGELDIAYVSADTNRNLRETFSLVGFTRSFQSFNR